MSYQFIPSRKKKSFSPRIQQIADEFAKHGFEYTGPDPDTDMESFKEMAFENRATSRPDSVYTNLLSLFRLQDEYSQDEYMIWKVEKHVRDKDDKDYRIEIVYGRRPEFEVEDYKDEQSGDVVDRRIRKWNMVYTQKWDKLKFDEIVKESKSKRFMLQIARTSTDYYTLYTGNPILIKETKLFRDSSYEELVEFDKRLEAYNKAHLVKELKNPQK